MNKNNFSEISPPAGGLNIVFISPEVAPFVKFGGLADVAWALPRALTVLGHRVKIIMPKFGTINNLKFGIKKYKDNLIIKTKYKDIKCNIKRGCIPDNIEVFLIENNEYYEMRANVYGYKDDARRFALLCKSALEFIREEKWAVDIIHSNDWMTGYVPNYLKTEYKDDPILSKAASVFTIHNLALQGVNKRLLSQTQIDQGNSPLPDIMDDDIFYINGLLRGIIYSDYLNTVSERYAREILTPEYGEGLDKILLEMRNKLVGIRNGVDYSILSPETDRSVYVNYGLSDAENKSLNKTAFQKEFDLEIDPSIPLISYVGRFSEQKGLGLLHETIRPLLNNINFQFAVVGGGDEYWEEFFSKLIKDYPKRVGGYLMISTTFAHKVYAASDILLHPSKFEPCGIAHAIAMKFGTIAIVRETGGLADSVIDYNKYPKIGDGFVFKEFNDNAFLIQVVKAITLYSSNKPLWRKIRNRAMSKDLSWTISASKYVDLYRKAMARHDRWLKREGIIMPDNPLEVPGYSSEDILS